MTLAETGLMIDCPEGTWAASVTLHLDTEEQVREWAHDRHAEIEFANSGGRDGSQIIIARAEENGAQVVVIARVEPPA